MGAGTELRAQKKDGSTFPVEIGLSPLNMPQGQFVVASIVDTSEWKRIQQDLENFNEQLKIKNQEMEQFIYTVSHDLKSPLVTIGGFTNQLVKSLDAKLDDKQKHKLIRIQHNVNHMFHTNHLKSILGFTAFLGLSAFASTVNAGQNDANVATDENAVVAKWQEFTETVADYATEQKEEATTSIHNQLQRIDKQITSLEKQVAERSTETREEALEKLKEQQQKVEDWANKLENNSEAAWIEMLRGSISRLT